MMKHFTFSGFLTVLFLLSACQKPIVCEAYLNGNKYQCSLGRSGVSSNKKEGDGATPVGDFQVREVFYRPDRLTKLSTAIPVIAMEKNMAWCDDVRSPYYNQQVELPFALSHENLWREDHVYDVVVIVGYNDQPVIKGKGSAIFMHIAREGYTPTAGCIAFSEKDLLKILKEIGPGARVKIEVNGKVTFYNDDKVKLYIQ
ncbi:MAG: L,D-transpeptidase family protein [Gammaproteobacteria bacterium]|nr:L,D-transpeptidase family protein [Gammaproteobacteria bacterium]